ncbi:hypothetical protein [Actinoplanes sp. NPDC023714]|uniref:hypothetical protein n=1 Tax=Actinoplanes sp. NPDC023714 TaxID=3154322 RepID=UPI0033DD099E
MKTIYVVDEMLASFEPANSLAAIEVMRICAERLGEYMEHAAASHDLADLSRLVCGLALIQANLAQAMERMVHNSDKRAFKGTADMPARTLRALAFHLRCAGACGGMLTGNLRDAYGVLDGGVR